MNKLEALTREGLAWAEGVAKGWNCPESEPATVNCSTWNRAPIKFRKVYSGPGYPIDPANKKARALESALNLEPQPTGVLDLRPLKRWLGESVN